MSGWRVRYLLLSLLWLTFLIPFLGTPVRAETVPDLDHDHVEAFEIDQILELGRGGDSDSEKMSALQKNIEELRGKIHDLESQRSTLAENIRLLDSRIQLTEKEIEHTTFQIRVLEAEISDLSQRISGLEVSLHDLSTILVKRVQAHYKQLASDDGMTRLMATAGVTQFLKEQKYLVQTRAHTQELLLGTEVKRQVYDEERARKEKKQTEVEKLRAQQQAQKNELNVQKADKQKLIEVTKNDEKVYQRRLADALAEFTAIQSIIAGRGQESEAGSVKTGDRIASVIPGPSACSTGAHLHFEVVKDGAHTNPAGYLKSADVQWHDSAFSFSGSWDWPVENPARVTQGYGMTSFARSGFYGGRPHTGIDMLSKSAQNWTVKAVQDGKLYRGAIPCGGGRLQYVRVKHTDQLSSYYLHVSY